MPKHSYGKKSGGSMGSVPMKGGSPKVPPGATGGPQIKYGSGETGRARPPGLNKTGPQRGNP